MKLEHREVNFEDARGSITDIFVNEPKQHCTIIVTHKGGIRGNHFHKLSRQHDFIISGRLEVFFRQTQNSGVERAVIGPGDLVTWDPNVAHEFIALEESVMITFVDGVRGGLDYEKDTYRLPTPLHELMKSENGANK
jgi:dTDP-4-dehydrorhamnose 3,5-epimerase-like enzyme